MAGNAPDPSRLCFELSYSLWVETAPRTYKHISSADTPNLGCLLPKGLPFDRFKAGIFRAMALDAHTVRLLRSADAEKKIEWRCCPSNPIDSSLARFVVTDEASFQAFMAREERSSASRNSSFPQVPPSPIIKITMAKPEETSNSGTPASSPISGKEATGSQSTTVQESVTPGELQSSSAGHSAVPRTLSSSGDPSHPSIKRPRLSQDAPKLDPNSLEMEAFLKICHIPLDDKHTRQLIVIHRVHHWTVFNHLSVDEMKDLGFSVGPAILLHAGASQVNRRVALEAAS
ncbi:hypothetical protein PTTG_06785 [Puccinia triticina 1-1 BBBD Race 1]|uniref:SAM domain-containing protein n=2 Tax=Puccinia triticina TaxID=208348 RepID=A0A0C4F115_PUCT1|nr:uncharacterized protein PtA15_4A697 [Puccinia triticina]OAV93734.1 hypothetical protein PTTG_06785 [Puccinia triticina 1-1 BBBD Race 1]WAQ84244.1 hypothetical protein PtA15_4A697 [Puccinia triticina]WAR55072.1 hypothetical protein PtB15_4B691 [Puccinia triticina]